MGQPQFIIRYDIKRLLREATRLGLSQRQLATRAGVHVMTVTRARRGYGHPSPQTMRRLARAVGLQVEDLVLAVDEVHEQATA